MVSRRLEIGDWRLELGITFRASRFTSHEPSLIIHHATQILTRHASRTPRILYVVNAYPHVTRPGLR